MLSKEVARRKSKEKELGGIELTKLPSTPANEVVFRFNADTAGENGVLPLSDGLDMARCAANEEEEVELVELSTELATSGQL